MERSIVKIRPYPHTSEAWYQRRWLGLWWTVKFKIGSTSEVLDWAEGQGADIVIQ